MGFRTQFQEALLQLGTALAGNFRRPTPRLFAALTRYRPREQTMPRDLFDLRAIKDHFVLVTRTGSKRPM